MTDTIKKTYQFEITYSKETVDLLSCSFSIRYFCGGGLAESSIGLQVSANESMTK